MESWDVSPLVNAPENDIPACILPDFVTRPPRDGTGRSQRNARGWGRGEFRDDEHPAADLAEVEP
jgi:hypothetical protein